MAVRPFYISTTAEGRQTPIEGGTKRKDGYMETTIYQRDRGERTTPFKVVQRSIEVPDPENPDKKVLELITEVYYQGELVKSHSTIY